MDPAAVASMLYCEDNEDLKEMYGPLKFENADLIILPVNDNTNPSKLSKVFQNSDLWLIVGGAHWALLVYYKGNAYYLDPSGTIILNAHSLAMKMKILINHETTEEVLSESYTIEVIEEAPK